MFGMNHQRAPTTLFAPQNVFLRPVICRVVFDVEIGLTLRVYPEQQVAVG